MDPNVEALWRLAATIPRCQMSRPVSSQFQSKLHRRFQINRLWVRFLLPLLALKATELKTLRRTPSDILSPTPLHSPDYRHRCTEDYS